VSYWRGAHGKDDIAIGVSRYFGVKPSSEVC